MQFLVSSCPVLLGLFGMLAPFSFSIVLYDLLMRSLYGLVFLPGICSCLCILVSFPLGMCLVWLFGFRFLVFC